MNCRTVGLVLFAAIFAAINLSITTPAQTTPFTKAQVADRIRKVEDGVDQFQKYLENRGQDAKNRGKRPRATERQHAGSVQVQRTHKPGEIKPSKRKTISRTPWTT
jgi:hypothetical protein